MGKVNKQSSNYVYMDNSSTTKPCSEVIEGMSFVQENLYGNPSSLYRFGLESESLLRQARNEVATLIGADETEVYFTSGGTEANNWALFGTLRAYGGNRRHIVTSCVEHPSVSATANYLERAGVEVSYVPVDEQGLVSPEAVIASIRPDTSLVSIMLVQNEVGTIEPCRDIGILLSQMGPKRPRFHVDAVQGFGRVEINAKAWGIDLLTMSSHKIHGPKGAGALFVREGTPLKPLIFGGGQERNLRSGTENVAGIHGFGIAAQLCKNTMKETNTNLYYLRQRLVQGITGISPDAVLNGAGPDGSSPHIVNFSFPGFRGETIVHGLEQRGVLVSTGSACSSRKKEPSPVLLAMGKTKSEAWSAIRFSMSRFSTKADVDTTILALEDCLEELKPWRKKTI